MYREHLSLVSKDTKGASIPLENFINYLSLAKLDFCLPAYQGALIPHLFMLAKAILSLQRRIKQLKQLKIFVVSQNRQPRLLIC